jgi:hypothetical protein
MPPDAAVAAAAGQASRGTKVWARTRAEVEPTVTLAPDDRAMSLVEAFAHPAGGSGHDPRPVTET